MHVRLTCYTRSDPYTLAYLLTLVTSSVAVNGVLDFSMLVWCVVETFEFHERSLLLCT